MSYKVIKVIGGFNKFIEIFLSFEETTCKRVLLLSLKLILVWDVTLFYQLSNSFTMMVH